MGKEWDGDGETGHGIGDDEMMDSVMIGDQQRRMAGIEEK